MFRVVQLHPQILAAVHAGKDVVVSTPGQSKSQGLDTDEGKVLV